MIFSVRFHVETLILIERIFFYQKANTFLHQQFIIPNSCTRVLLFFGTHLHMSIIRIISYFGRIIIDIIVLRKEKKDV